MPVHDWTRVGSGIFHDFHGRWIGAIRDYLNAGNLPHDYYALGEQVAAGPQPDVVALQTTAADDAPDAIAENGGAIAVLEAPPRVKYVDEVEADTYARTARYVAIYHACGDRVVAFIEIVSPGNKRSIHELDRFLDKLDGAVRRGIHLLVIDLHPPGKFDPRGIHAAFWARRSDNPHGVSEAEPLVMSAYCVHDAPRAYFEPVRVGAVLPYMPIFLTPYHYVNVPIERTYLESWRGVPDRWKQVLESAPQLRRS